MLSERVKRIIKKYTESCPVVIRETEEGDKYPYAILPLEGLNFPEFLEAVVDGILEIANFNGCDKIVTMEAKGIPIATALSLKTGVPFVIARKRQYGLPGEIIVEQKKAYKGRADMYINWVKKGDKVIVIDDIISSGGTMSAVIDGLREVGAAILDFVVVWDRGHGLETVEKNTGYKIKSLARFKMEETENGSRPKVEYFYGEPQNSSPT